MTTTRNPREPHPEGTLYMIQSPIGAFLHSFRAKSDEDAKREVTRFLRETGRKRVTLRRLPPSF